MKAVKNIMDTTYSRLEEKQVPLGATYYSITIQCKDEKECDIWVQKINQLIKDNEGRVKVY